MMMMASPGVGLGGDYSTGMAGSIYAIDDGKIIEPKEVDVLCGRGGMSNHHPGNEWYRRLIRSNRPLYRACPKHTKLLVAKAIVQAVEQQNGRFLERSKKNGYWYKVPYKRAVDKTSQGLRERERDSGAGGSNNSDSGSGGGSNRKRKQSKKGKKGDNDSDDDDDDFGDDDGSDFDDDEEYQGEVPIGFRGSDQPPNLVELASVAITNELNRYSSRNNNNLVGRRKSPEKLPASKTSLLGQQQMKPSANDNMYDDDNFIDTDNIRRYNDEMNANKRMKLDNNSNNRPQHQLPRYQQQQQPNSSYLMQSSQGAMSMTQLLPSESTMSMMPLPPSMQLRESSMFRLLRHPKLLPVNSAVHPNLSVAASGNNQNDGTTLPSPSFGNRGVSSNLWTSPNTPGRGGGGGLFRQPNQQQQQQQKFNNQNNGLQQRQPKARQEPYYEQQQGPLQPMNAPTLTRLTTQVSDWLRNSFWPLNGTVNAESAVNTENNNNSNEIKRDGGDIIKDRIMVPPPSRRAAVEQAQRLVASIPPPKKKDNTGYNNGNHDKGMSPAPAPITLVFPQPLVKPMKTPQGRLTRKSLIDDDEEEEDTGTNSRQAQRQPGHKINNMRQPEQRPYHGFQQNNRDSFGSNATTSDPSSNNDTTGFPKMPSVNKRKSSAALPTLPYGSSESTFSLFGGFLDKLDNSNSESPESVKNQNKTSPSKSDGQDEDDPLIANGTMNDDNILPHTELEQSVSTTLLKLAGSTPSMLLSGLTSFFDRGGPKPTVNDDNDENKARAKSNNVARQPVQASKKSKSSLLDDYEESPMEARLRTVAPW